ncbi:MAG TPA: thiamine pyrophosphate-binding protein [Anaerolineae bacterium]|nr:thiamine pyrophosphate-binding protein [Anaerolineae bacterium]
MLGMEALLEILAASGVRHIFGNPGSTELSLNDVLVGDGRFEYILGLHELPVTAMADGYAQASGGLGVVCVHISPGLGNAMGMLFNAYCAGTPLLLLAGQQDRRLLVGEPALAGDMVSVARPWTKWSVEVLRVEDVPTVVRRAVQTALTPPTGPVFLSVPVDVQLESAENLDLSAPHIPDRRVRPPLDALHQAAELLAQARNPAILAGSRVTEANGVAELVLLAERLGAPVLSEQQSSHARLPMPADHGLYAGALPLRAPDVRQRLADFDVIFVVGMNLLRQFIYREPSRPLPEHVRLIHLDDRAWEIGKNYPVEIGLLGDPKAGLAELAQRVSEKQSEDQVRAAAQRRVEHSARRAAEREALLADIETQWDQRPMTAATLMGALSRVLPPNTALVDEAPSRDGHLLETLGVFRDPTGHIGHRGWGLGWGLGSAVGVKLAWPHRPVVALLGDGAALYGIQGLWTAAHHHIPVVFLIANNAQYKILKVIGAEMQLPQVVQGKYLGMDLVGPEVDFVGLARSLGVEACRATEPEELSGRVRDALHRTEPILLDVTIER